MFPDPASAGLGAADARFGPDDQHPDGYFGYSFPNDITVGLATPDQYFEVPPLTTTRDDGWTVHPERRVTIIASPDGECAVSVATLAVNATADDLNLIEQTVESLKPIASP